MCSFASLLGTTSIVLGERGSSDGNADSCVGGSLRKPAVEFGFWGQLMSEKPGGYCFLAQNVDQAAENK
jgi:hypothetical protein